MLFLSLLKALRPGELTVGLMMAKVHLMSNEDLISLYIALRNMARARGKWVEEEVHEVERYIRLNTSG